MTTYTMNGHRHPTIQIQPEILIGIVGNQAAQFRRVQWRMRAMPEKFSCLENPNPQAQLQEALKQIEDLLQRNMELLETVFLLSQALSDAHSLVRKDDSIHRSDRDKLRLSHDFHGYMKQLRGEIRAHVLE